ncbi:NACHT and TPR domain-containing protein [Colletotrichum asianum]
MVMVFFEDMNNFLQRIVILKTRLPKYNAYQNCLMEIFTSFLTVCGFAHKYIELGRFMGQQSNPRRIQGEDNELGGARKKMDLRIRRLQEATEFAILDNIEEIQKMTSKLLKSQHSHTAMLEEQMQAAENSSRRTCVAQFYFREQNESLSSFTNGVISVIDQVVEQSPELCEAMYAEIVRDESKINRGSFGDLLRKLLGVAFGKDSKGRLFLVFDGIDEIANRDFALFEQFGNTVDESALRISMVYTARPDICIQESSPNPPFKIKITREKQMDDLITVIWARINSLSALKKFSRYVQQRIADKTEEIAPNILHAEHLLARLNTLEEIPEPLAKLLRIGYPDSGAETRAKIQSRGGWATAIDELENAHKASQSDDLYQDGNLPIKFRERSMRGLFRLRSWAGLLPDVKVSLSTEAAEWRALIAERPRDCLLQLAKSHVRRLQDAVDMNTAEASFSAASGALRICGKGTTLEEQARENFASAIGDVSGALSAKQAVLGLDGLCKDTHLGSNGYHWLAALQSLYKQDAAASYEMIKLFENEPGKQKFIRTLKTWSPLERLAYLCWDTWDSVYQAVFHMAVESGEVAFVVQMYQESIRLLENVNAFAPLLVELGYLHINATRDLEAARTVFDQALDSGSTGWPEVLYRLSRESADVKRKRELLGAVEGLLIRPLALDMPPISNTALLYRQIVFARMYLKLGPAEKFHQTLQGVIDACVAALSDNIG